MTPENFNTNFNVEDIEFDKYVNKRSSRNLTPNSLFQLKEYLHKIKNALRSVFLPVGFPDTVPKEYISFQMWNLIQNLCSYLRGIMSIQAVFEGMGVGTTNVTPTQATIQWVLRDGSSLVGGLIFTSKLSYDFGQNVKIWRLFADTINNVGLTLDMLAPLFKNHFLFIVCVASVCKALCGIAAGATGAAISEHWGSKHGNIADVLAKNGAQSTMVSLLGLAMSVQFAKLVNTSLTRIWIIYTILTCIHMYCNYKAMRILALRSINLSRYKMLIQSFLHLDEVQNYLQNYSNSATDSIINRTDSHQILDENKDSNVLSNEYIASLEPILMMALPEKYRDHLFQQKDCLPANYNNKVIVNLYSSISKSIEKNLKYESESSIRERIEIGNQSNYVIFLDPSSESIHVCQSIESSSMDIAKGAFEAFLVKNSIEKHQISPMNWNNLLLLNDSKNISNQLFPQFIKLLEKNDWDLKRLQLKPKGVTAYQPFQNDYKNKAE